MAWRFTKVHANLIHWLISTQVMGTVEAVEKKENRVRVKWDGDDTYKHLTLREAQRLRAEDEPGEEEPEKVDAVVDIGDDDVVFVVDEEAATAEAAVGILDDIGIGGKGVDPKAKYLEVLRATTTLNLADDSGLLGVPYPDENNPDAVQRFKEKFENGIGIAEVEELVPDRVLNIVQRFYEELAKLKVIGSRERLASSSAVWKSTSASGAPDNSSLSHFSATTRPCWLNRVVRDPHGHAVELASRRWRGGHDAAVAETRRENLIYALFAAVRSEFKRRQAPRPS